MSTDYDEDPGSGATELPAGGYRTYEVYQRERVGETTNLISPRTLISDDFLADPYPSLETLREHYPCYRDWVGNRFWITRYDDVTSVLADTANYEARPKSGAYAGAAGGRSLWGEAEIESTLTRIVDERLDDVVGRVLDDLLDSDTIDLATGFAARLPIELWSEVLGIAAEDRPAFAARWWRMHRGTGWAPHLAVAGRAAFAEFVDAFDAQLRRPADDLLGAAASIGASALDVAVSLCDADHETLHGGLANLWFQLLAHPDQLASVHADPRLMKFAWLEALRHSPAVIHAERFARHEVERFGRLLPDGAMVLCSTAAANRDPRVFDDPDEFVVERADLCQREPRGHYRADGLASGIAIGLGLPSVHPAMPKERPRSRYALVRDVAVTASQALLDRAPTIRIADGAAPRLQSLHLGEMHTCWTLPVDV